MRTARSKPSCPPAPYGSARSPNCARISRATRKPVDGAREHGPALRLSSFVGLVRRERERAAVHAVARAGRLRPIRKDVPQMRVACCAAHFGAPHEERAVVVLAHGAFCDRCEKARPAGARFEFGGGRKQRRAAGDAVEHALALFLIERAGEGALGAVLAGDMILLGCELLAPFGIGLDHFRAWSGIHDEVLAGFGCSLSGSASSRDKSHFVHSPVTEGRAPPPIVEKWPTIIEDFSDSRQQDLP